MLQISKWWGGGAFKPVKMILHPNFPSNLFPNIGISPYFLSMNSDLSRDYIYLWTGMADSRRKQQIFENNLSWSWNRALKSLFIIEITLFEDSFIKWQSKILKKREIGMRIRPSLRLELVDNLWWLRRRKQFLLKILTHGKSSL